MPAKLRDPDQIACYCAETALRGKLDVAGGHMLEVHGNRISVPLERKFGQLEHVGVYVDWVMRSGFVKTMWPKAAAVPVRVRRRSGQDGKAHYETRSREGGPAIAINNPKHGTPWGQREVIVLHEVAHHLSVQEYGDAGHGHGLAWRRVFIELIGEFVGAEAAWLLQVEMMDQGLTVA